MKCLIVIFSLVLIYVEGDPYLNANGPFGRRHSIGDEPRPHICDRRHGISSFSRILAVTNINISSATCSSDKLITVTWISISNVYVDDFIGIYFVNIPLSEGNGI